VPPQSPSDNCSSLTLPLASQHNTTQQHSPTSSSLTLPVSPPDNSIQTQHPWLVLTPLLLLLLLLLPLRKVSSLLLTLILNLTTNPPSPALVTKHKPTPKKHNHNTRLSATRPVNLVIALRGKLVDERVLLLGPEQFKHVLELRAKAPPRPREPEPTPEPQPQTESESESEGDWRDKTPDPNIFDKWSN
jgi:hypothetical protein